MTFLCQPNINNSQHSQNLIGLLYYVTKEAKELPQEGCAITSNILHAKINV